MVRRHDPTVRTPVLTHQRNDSCSLTKDRCWTPSLRKTTLFHSVFLQIIFLLYRKVVSKQASKQASSLGDVVLPVVDSASTGIVSSYSQGIFVLLQCVQILWSGQYFIAPLLRYSAYCLVSTGFSRFVS